jgi:hypothetical protein
VQDFLKPGFKRVFAQIVVGLVFLASGLVMLALLILTYIQSRWGLQGWLSDFGKLVVRGIASPGNNAIAEGFAPIVAVFPAIIGYVCFGVEQTAEGLKANSTLNRLGKASVIALALGLVCGVGVLITYNVSFNLLNQIVRIEDVTALVGPVVTGVIAFQLLYILKLLGLENFGANSS